MGYGEPHLLPGLCIGLPVLLLKVPVVVVWEWGGAGEASRSPEFPQTHSSDSQQRQGPCSVDTHLPARGALDDCEKEAVPLSDAPSTPNNHTGDT